MLKNGKKEIKVLQNECFLENVVTLDTMAHDFYVQCRFDDVNEIIDGERDLKHFKSMYVKHAFDAMAAQCRELYDTQDKFLKLIKDQYRSKYGT